MQQFTLLKSKQKANFTCDFIARFGPELNSVGMELDASYKLKWLPFTYVAAQKYTGRRGAQGSIVWVEGSDDPGPNDKKELERLHKIVVIQPNFDRRSYSEHWNYQ